jgi:hypothetical protein
MRSVKIGEEEVEINPEHLEFSESTLNDYLQKSPRWYNYYSEMHSKAQLYASVYEDKYEQVYSEKFRFYKAEGGSDKLAEASAKADPDVAAALMRARRAKEIQGVLGGFLRAMDKSIQNALNLGYNIRKEMDKLGKDTIHQKSLEEIVGL